jgi:dethiobiotin synthetase
MDETMRGLFVTATDTGAGKTFVATAVARSLRRRGVAVRVIKPVAAGAEWVGGRWLSDDARVLAEASGEPDPSAVAPFTFPAAAAPPVAARLAGTTLSLGDVANAVRARSSPNTVTLVEGIGGLLCPLTERETVADLAAALGLPLLVVARRSLGTLNHTLLTLEVARGRRLAVAGVVVTETEPVSGPAAQTNVEELRRRIDVPLLAVFPHCPACDPPEADAVDWAALAGRGNLAPGAASISERPRRLPEHAAACRP